DSSLFCNKYKYKDSVVCCFLAISRNALSLIGAAYILELIWDNCLLKLFTLRFRLFVTLFKLESNPFFKVSNCWSNLTITGFFSLELSNNLFLWATSSLYRTAASEIPWLDNPILEGTMSYF